MHQPESQSYATFGFAGIVHELTKESWGVRRFFVRAPDGSVINMVSHTDE